MPNKGAVSKKDYVWDTCIDCGGQRWIKKRYGRFNRKRCRTCAGKLKPPPAWNYFKSGEDNPMWKGGRIVDNNGYIQIKVFQDDLYFPMATIAGYVKEHRLVMAKHLGRCLEVWEIVHHKDRNRHNNSLDNLELTNFKEHYPAKHLLARIEELEAEVMRLKGTIEGITPPIEI